MRAYLTFILLVLLIPSAAPPSLTVDDGSGEGEAGIYQETPHPVINEVLPNAHKDWDGNGVGDYRDEWIELFNPYEVPVTLDGLYITDRSGSPEYHLSGSLSPGGYLVLYRKDTGIVLGPSDEVTLYNETGVVLDSVSFDFRFYDVSVGRRPNGVGEFYIDGEPTPGRANNPPPHLIINEVMVDPPGANTGRQWVEIYNPGPSTNLTGIKLWNSEGFYYYFPPIHFPSGAYAVVYLKPGENTRTDYCYKFYTDREYYFFSSGDNLLLQTYRKHPLDYVAWGRSTHIDEPPSVDGKPLWNGTYYNETTSTYSGEMVNPTPRTGYTLSRLPNGVDTDSPLDWFLTPPVNQTEGWNNSQPIIFEMTFPEEVHTDPGNPVVVNLTFSNRSPVPIQVNLTVESVPEGWIVPEPFSDHYFDPATTFVVENYVITPPTSSDCDPSGSVTFVVSEAMGRRVWRFHMSLYLNLPDLSVESIYFDPYHGGEVFQGESVEVSSRVYNRGVVTAGEVVVRGYVEWGGGRWLFMEREYSDLGPGRYRVPRGVFSTSNLSGEISVVIEAELKRIFDLNESNNVLSRNLTVTPPPPMGGKAHLKISEINVNVSFEEQYIKIHNPLSERVSLEGVALQCGEAVAIFPSATYINGGETVTVAYDATTYRETYGDWPDFFQKEGGEEVPQSLKGHRMTTPGYYLKMSYHGGELLLRTEYYQTIDAVVWGEGDGVQGWVGPPVPVPVKGWPIKRISSEDTNTSSDFLPPLPNARILAVSPHDPHSFRAEYVVVKVEGPINHPLLLTDGEGVVVLRRSSWRSGVYIETLNATSFFNMTTVLPDFAIEGWGGRVEKADPVSGYFYLANPGDQVTLMDPFFRPISSVAWGDGNISPPNVLETLYFKENGEVIRNVSAEYFPWALREVHYNTSLAVRHVSGGLAEGVGSGSGELVVISTHLLSENISWILGGGWRSVEVILDEASLTYLTQEEIARLYRNCLQVLERGGVVMLREALDPPTPIPLQAVVASSNLYIYTPLPPVEGVPEGIFVGPVNHPTIFTMVNNTIMSGRNRVLNASSLREALQPPDGNPKLLVPHTLLSITRRASISMQILSPLLIPLPEFTSAILPPGLRYEELMELGGSTDGGRILLDPSSRYTLNPQRLLEAFESAAFINPASMGRSPAFYMADSGEQFIYAPRTGTMISAGFEVCFVEGGIYEEAFNTLWDERLERGEEGENLLLDRIYYNTAVKGEEDEFFAIYNPSSRPVDLGGYLITDWEGGAENPTDGAILLPPGLKAPPGGWIYLSRTTTYFSAYWGKTPEYTYMWSAKPLFGDMRLANSRDSLSVFSPDGKLLDRIVWGDKFGLFGVELNGSGFVEGWVGAPLPPFSSPKMLERFRDSYGNPVDTNRWQDFNIYSSPMPGKSYLLPEVFTAEEAYLYVAPEGALTAFRRATEMARREILIEVYTLSSPEVVSALKLAAMRGVDVKVLVEGYPVGGMSLEEKWALKEIHKGGGEVYLMDRGEIWATRYRYIHAKYAVVDSEWLLIQSENLGPSALTPPNSSGNRGWGALIRSSGLATFYRTLFYTDLNGTYDIKRYPEVEEEISPPQDYTPPINLGDGKYLDRFPLKHLALNETPVTPVLSPDFSVGELSPLIKVLKEARKEILIELLSMDLIFSYASREYRINYSREDTLFLEGEGEYWMVNPLLKAVVEAAERGVEVRILMDSTDFNGDGKADNYPAVSYINTLSSKLSIPIKARLISPGVKAAESLHGTLHNKGVVVDGKKVLISSINWGQNSVYNNREAAVILDSPTAAEYYRNVFLWDWNLTLLERVMSVRVSPGRFLSLPVGGNITVSLTLYGWGAGRINLSWRGDGRAVVEGEILVGVEKGETHITFIIREKTPGDSIIVVEVEGEGMKTDLAVFHINGYEKEEGGGKVPPRSRTTPVLYLIIIVLSAALAFDIAQRLYERRKEGEEE